MATKDLRTAAEIALENLDRFFESDCDEIDYADRARDELRAALFN
jgi:hypothetical protein